MKNKKAVFLTTSIIFLSLFFVLTAQQALFSTGLSTQSIYEILLVLNKNYVEPLDNHLLIKGAYKGLNEFCKQKKITLPQTDATKQYDNAGDELKAFNGYFNQVMQNSSGIATEEELLYASFNGMMNVIHEKPYDDPFTLVLTPREYKRLTEDLSGGNFGGVGLYFNKDAETGEVMVVEPIKGTPAYKFDIKPRDIILKIDGERTKGMDLDVAAQKMRGEVGTKVVLTFKRPSKAQPFDIEITRAIIHVSSVEASIMNKYIGYVKIVSFNRDTGLELKTNLDKLESKGIKAVILDLRNNPGGYVSAAIDVCGEFMPAGTVVVSTANFQSNVKQDYRVTSYNCRDLPVVVLVNELSASASEITAGAILDNKRGIIMGEQTYGKATVQTFYDLPNGGALKYTMAHYFTPSGKNISKKGLKPDLVIKMDEKITIGSDRDEQLKIAIKYLLKKYVK